MSTSDEDVLESEFEDDEEAEGGLGAVKKLREKLRKALEEKQENLDGWQRARADFANFKRDELQRSTDQDLRLKSKMAEAIIPTLDSFEMALKDKSFIGAEENLQKGFGAVYTHLLKSLERLGITRFEPTGEKFDPYRHEALREVPTEDESKDHVIESVHRAGYSIDMPGQEGERIVRPAQVSVFTHTAQ